jgi:transcriptional regulator GlxA family with amidase domain
MAQRTVLLVLFDGVQSLDVTGPLEVFAGAELRVRGSYGISTASLDGAPVRTSSGLTLVPDTSLAAAPAPHTLLVPGGQGTRSPAPALTDWLRAHGPRTPRLVSVCTGAILLAEAGLLDGRRVTTHWAYCDKLARDHPAVRVDPDPIYVRDGPVATSAGVTAGIDLALALVEDDHGPDLTRGVARSLVVYMQRAGGQSQFSASLQGPAPQTPVLRLVQDAVQTDPTGDHTVESLAALVRVSPRHLTRLFRAELDTTPMKYVEVIRFDMAKALLDAGHNATEAAAHAGFPSYESLRRAFARHLGVSPTRYRQRFASTRRDVS